MANAPSITVAIANAMLDALGGAANTGVLRLYDGTKPTNSDTAPGGDTHVLAELTMAADAFPSASSGILTAGAITLDSSVNLSGTASWFRLYASNGTTALCDGTVGTASCDLNLDNNILVAGGTCSVSSMTIGLPLV